ncbi:unnamed protein product, partial [Discosporangium mesarthrocarpum]
RSIEERGRNQTTSQTQSLSNGMDVGGVDTADDSPCGGAHRESTSWEDNLRSCNLDIKKGCGVARGRGAAEGPTSGRRWSWNSTAKEWGRDRGGSKGIEEVGGVEQEHSSNVPSSLEHSTNGTLLSLSSVHRWLQIDSDADSDLEARATTPLPHGRVTGLSCEAPSVLPIDYDSDHEILKRHTGIGSKQHGKVASRQGRGR